MLGRIIIIGIVGCVLGLFSAVHAEEAQDFSDALTEILEDEALSLTEAKLRIDALVDPDINIAATRAKIRHLADNALRLAGTGATDGEKVLALKQLIYQPGLWNFMSPFSYDFDNPQGRRAQHKTLAYYLDTRKGNCVSMPLLFLAVADEMGVEMNISPAPQHVFLQFDNPDTGTVQHLEATSGADPQRIVWQRQVLPMTDKAIETGMYMKRLSRREMIAGMAETLLQDLAAKGNQRERFEVAQLMVREFPQFDVALLHTINASRALIREEIVSQYPTPADIPDDAQADFDTWALADAETQQRLFELGWCPKGKIEDGECTISFDR